MSERSAEDLLRQARVVVQRGPFALAAWAPGAFDEIARGVAGVEGPVLLLRDERETTGLVREQHLAGLPPPQAVERGFCLLTLDVELDWSVVGVLALVTKALGEAGIPAGALAAYSRDHLLVPAPRLNDALKALGGLCNGVATLP